jgi:hypothetical protein
MLVVWSAQNCSGLIVGWTTLSGDRIEPLWICFKPVLNLSEIGSVLNCTLNTGIYIVYVHSNVYIICAFPFAYILLICSDSLLYRSNQFRQFSCYPWPNISAP